MISLTTRVSLAAALVLTAFVALTAVTLERAFENSARSAMRERLFAQLYLLMAATEVGADGTLHMPERFAEPRFNLPGSGLYARIDTPAGNLLWQSPSAIGLRPPRPANISPGAEVFAQTPYQNKEYFLASLAIEWESDGGPIPLVFSVAEEPASFIEQMHTYHRNLWGGLGAMAVLLLATLAAALAWGLRPLRTVAAEVRAIESGAQASLQQTYPKELRGLTDNINALLQYERTQQTRYKNALADLAHSLKTPLAVLRGLAGEISSKHSLQFEEQVGRMDNIVQYQLQRAATAGRSALASPQPISPVAERILATLAKVHQGSIQVKTSLEPLAHFRGDEGDLMELLGNLLDNAYKWARGRISLTISCQQNRLLLRVEDDGPGIEKTKAEQVLTRGIRLDEATPGHGIGLPMVRDIVEAYEGKLRISRSSLGGASISIQLPGCQLIP